MSLCRAHARRWGKSAADRAPTELCDEGRDVRLWQWLLLHLDVLVQVTAVAVLDHKEDACGRFLGAARSASLALAGTCTSACLPWRRARAARALEGDAHHVINQARDVAVG